MIFLKLFAYIFVCYGATETLVYADGPFKLIGFFRTFLGFISEEFTNLLSCMRCTSYWVACILSLIDVFLIPSIAFTPFNMIIGYETLWYFTVPLDMAFSAGIVWVLHQLEEMMERAFEK